MADVSYASAAGNVGNQFRAKAVLGRAKAQGFRVENTYWGYIVHGDGSQSWAMTALQVLGMIFGACFMGAAISLLILPTVSGDALDFAFRAVAAGVLAAVASYLMWFATRGSVLEIQVDTQKGEVREATRTRSGKSTVLSRYGLDSIGGVFLDRSAGRPGEATLALRYGNTSQTLSIARGRPSSLEKLRDRIGRDLILDYAVTRDHQFKIAA